MESKLKRWIRVWLEGRYNFEKNTADLDWSLQGEGQSVLITFQAIVKARKWSTLKGIYDHSY
jgi:hypothetical protein